MERNESQGTGTPNKRNYTEVSMELAAKAAGVFKVPSFREGLLIVICFGLLIWLLQINLFPRTLDIKVGQVSKLDIRTPRDVVNWEATEQARKQAEDIAVENAIQDASFYKIDEIAAQTAVVKLKNLFDILGGFRKRYQPEKLRTLTEDALPMRKIQAFFYETPSVQLLKDILLLEPAYYDELQEKSVTILADLELQLQITKEDLASQKAQLPDFIGKYPVSEAVQPVLLALLNVVIRPNMVLDAEKLADLKKSVVNDFPRIIQKQNDLIISKGQVVTEKDIKMLNELHLIADKSNRVRVFFSLSFLILFLVGLGLLYIYVFHPKLFREERLLYLILLLLILVLGLIKVLSLIDHPALPFLAPVSFAVMLLTILVNPPSVSLTMAIIISLLGGIIVNFNLELTIFYFVSSIVTVLSLAHFRRQRDLVRSGLLLMVSNMITVVFLNLLFRTRFEPMAVLLASVNGFFSAVLAIGLLPFLENAFKVISPIRLLELSNPGHPLIRRLQIEAPGTYHHSIIVANLAEAAAQQIGADSLWVRVGSYYHDIGKIKRPYFFVENQFGQENPHEKLTPTLSTLVITSHVKDGVEIAREHGLPNKLIDIIRQHHGTDLVRYFFNKAAENLQDEKEVLAEADFRYEGPKPQTKEAALVMLADSVEAAVKALPKANPAKIEALIQKIIRERLDEGQFDECNLTLKDLTLVKNSFVKVLGGLYHSRIEYPEKVLKEIERKKTNADVSK
jgi:putative nucleotidyltransferase with HDIG domain